MGSSTARQKGAGSGDTWVDRVLIVGTPDCDHEHGIMMGVED